MNAVARRARYDIIDRKNDVVKRLWHLRRNRKRKTLQDEATSSSPVLVRGHRLISRLASTPSLTNGLNFSN